MKSVDQWSTVFYNNHIQEIIALNHENQTSCSMKNVWQGARELFSDSYGQSANIFCSISQSVISSVTAVPNISTKNASNGLFAPLNYSKNELSSSFLYAVHEINISKKEKSLMWTGLAGT